jgi:hypothetical protein
MKIYVFGDSFAELRPQDNLNWQWQYQVAQYFNCDLVNVANNGASAEWLTLKLAKFWNEFEINDILICFIPYWDRSCIFPNDPDFTHLFALDQYGKDDFVTERWNRYTKEQRDAFKKYFMYLHDIDLVRLKTASLYAWIDNLACTCLNIHPLVIETRDQNITNRPRTRYITASGYMMDTSINEWTNESVWNEITKYGLYDDKRVSHLSKKNHDILANKIITYIEKRVTPDLTTGFYKNFLDKNYIDTSIQR